MYDKSKKTWSQRLKITKAEKSGVGTTSTITTVTTTTATTKATAVTHNASICPNQLPKHVYQYQYQQRASTPPTPTIAVHMPVYTQQQQQQQQQQHHFNDFHYSESTIENGNILVRPSIAYEYYPNVLSRSKKYADPWVYSTVRGVPQQYHHYVPQASAYQQATAMPNPSTIFTAIAHPISTSDALAVVICSCPEYLNGTKRDVKKAHVCKKCKGSRLPLATISGGSTVRLQSTGALKIRPSGVATMRVVSTNKRMRPTILQPQHDPYDQMRRLRLLSPSREPGSGISRDNSNSIGRGRRNQTKLLTSKLDDVATATDGKVFPYSCDSPTSESKESWPADGNDTTLDNSSFSIPTYTRTSRRSILRCNVNPYDLISFKSTQSSNSHTEDTLIASGSGVPHNSTNKFVFSQNEFMPPNNDFNVEDAELNEEAPPFSTNTSVVKKGPTPNSRLGLTSSTTQRHKSVKSPRTTKAIKPLHSPIGQSTSNTDFDIKNSNNKKLTNNFDKEEDVEKSSQHKYCNVQEIAGQRISLGKHKIGKKSIIKQSENECNYQNFLVDDDNNIPNRMKTGGQADCENQQHKESEAVIENKTMSLASVMGMDKIESSRYQSRQQPKQQPRFVRMEESIEENNMNINIVVVPSNENNAASNPHEDSPVTSGDVEVLESVAVLTVSPTHNIKSILKRKEVIDVHSNLTTSIGCNVPTVTNKMDITTSSATNQYHCDASPSEKKHSNNNINVLPISPSQFYVPLPQARKKVQFMVEDSIIIHNDDVGQHSQNDQYQQYEDCEYGSEYEVATDLLSTIEETVGDAFDEFKTTETDRPPTAQVDLLTAAQNDSDLASQTLSVTSTVSNECPSSTSKVSDVNSVDDDIVAHTGDQITKNAVNASVVNPPISTKIGTSMHFDEDMNVNTAPATNKSGNCDTLTNLFATMTEYHAAPQANAPSDVIDAYADGYDIIDQGYKNISHFDDMDKEPKVKQNDEAVTATPIDDNYKATGKHKLRTSVSKSGKNYNNKHRAKANRSDNEMAQDLTYAPSPLNTTGAVTNNNKRNKKMNEKNEPILTDTNIPISEKDTVVLRINQNHNNLKELSSRGNSRPKEPPPPPPSSATCTTPISKNGNINVTGQILQNQNDDGSDDTDINYDGDKYIAEKISKNVVTNSHTEAYHQQEQQQQQRQQIQNNLSEKSNDGSISSQEINISNSLSCVAAITPTANYKEQKPWQQRRQDKSEAPTIIGNVASMRDYSNKQKHPQRTVVRVAPFNQTSSQVHRLQISHSDHASQNQSSSSFSIASPTTLPSAAVTACPPCSNASLDSSILTTTATTITGTIPSISINYTDVSIRPNDDCEIHKKTSILINGHSYSTIHDTSNRSSTPLYQSSVVVRGFSQTPIPSAKQDDCVGIHEGPKVTTSNTITINVSSPKQGIEEELIYHNNKINKLLSLQRMSNTKTLTGTTSELNLQRSASSTSSTSTNSITSLSSKDSNNRNDLVAKPDRTFIRLDHEKENPDQEYPRKEEEIPVCSIDEQTEMMCHENELLKILRNPVEAVKHNLVPHVCGRPEKLTTKDKQSLRTKKMNKGASNMETLRVPAVNSDDVGKVSRLEQSKIVETPDIRDNSSFILKLLEDPTLSQVADGLDTDTMAELIENSLNRLKNSIYTIDISGTKENDDMDRLINLSLRKIKEERQAIAEASSGGLDVKTNLSVPIKDDDRQSNRGSISSANSFVSANNYEMFDFDAANESDCYQSCSSEIASPSDDDLTSAAIRSKFYQMLVDATLAEIEMSTNMEEEEAYEHHYESIRNNGDPIYEEITDVPPPLPLTTPPLNDSEKKTVRSIFEGASKYDILSYLVDAKERGVVREENFDTLLNCSKPMIFEEEAGDKLSALGKQKEGRHSRVSIVSNSSKDNQNNMSALSPSPNNSIYGAANLLCGKGSLIDIERNDSGVGSETSKCSRSKYQNPINNAVNTRPPNIGPIHLCEDCDGPVEIQITESGVKFAPLVCRKCAKKRIERKEIITEIFETEEKYGRDLQIILEEFCHPMFVAGLLTQEQLSAIFLNTEELLENNHTLAERMRDSLNSAFEQGDDDLLTVNIGKIFLESTQMLHAFESYCVRQAGASLLLANLEKEKELLRIFLKVSQMENVVLRRMNLNSFLMVPVQRVTKYPLLLARLFKVSPAHLEGRDQLKQAQQKIELHLNHINQEAKDVPTKLWRRISSSSPNRRASCEIDMINIKLRKMAIDILEWNHDEVQFAMEGKLLYLQPTDNNWKKARTIKLTPVNALLATNGKPSTTYKAEKVMSDRLKFPKHTGIREASLLVVKEKCGRYTLIREPLYLDKCIVCSEADWDDYFEVQEISSKDTYIFKAEDGVRTKQWYTQLQYHAQGMGTWRKRRNALANIMINGMLTRS